MKLHSLKNTYRFFVEFFLEEDWIFRHNVNIVDSWLEAYEIFTVKKACPLFNVGEAKLRIKSDRLYLLYKCYAKDLGKAVQKTTFFNDAEELGVVKRERCYNVYRKTQRRTMMILNARVIKRNLKRKIEYDFGKWATEFDETRKRIIKMLSTYSYKGL